MVHHIRYVGTSDSDYNKPQLQFTSFVDLTTLAGLAFITLWQQTFD
jgi:hypothetical protein